VSLYLEHGVYKIEPQVASKLLIIQNLQEARFGKATSTGDAKTNPERNQELLIDQYYILRETEHVKKTLSKNEFSGIIYRVFHNVLQDYKKFIIGKP
jgi:hypothetical protein